MASPSSVYIFAACAILLQPGVESANILAVFPHVGKSHFFMFQPFVHKLGERGHQVTVVTHFPPKNPPANVSYISLEGSTSQKAFNSISLDDVEIVSSVKELASFIMLNMMGQDACETGLTHPPVQELIKSKRHFDLVIVEFFNTDCFAVLAHIFKAPLAGIFSSAMMPYHTDRFGTPDNPAYIVNHFFGHPSEMNFFQRVVNSFATYGMKFGHRFLFDMPTDWKIRKYLGDGFPSVREIVKNSSLFLINSHFSLFQPRPLVPGIVEIGGIHVEPPKKLPADIQKYLDDSPNGVVLFSLGSTVRGSTMPEEKKKAFLGAFSKIPLNVLWKWENETMPGKPDNVFIGQWFPQSEVLAHPKVKLFVTHSGLMGTEEAVYHGVPMVAMPLFGDQPLNAASCAEKGIAVVIDYYSVTEESLVNAIRTVLEDKRYAENAKRLSTIFKDRPLSNMDNAIYWTEYVIKYKGAHHLRSAVVRLPWYSEYLFDVALFTAFVLVILFFTIRKVFQLLCLVTKGKNKQKQH